jgi:hypothetical protein
MHQIRIAHCQGRGTEKLKDLTLCRHITSRCICGWGISIAHVNDSSSSHASTPRRSSCQSSHNGGSRQAAQVFHCLPFSRDSECDSCIACHATDHCRVFPRGKRAGLCHKLPCTKAYTKPANAIVQAMGIGNGRHWWHVTGMWVA